MKSEEITSSPYKNQLIQREKEKEIAQAEKEKAKQLREEAKEVKEKAKIQKKKAMVGKENKKLKTKSVRRKLELDAEESQVSY